MSPKSGRGDGRSRPGLDQLLELDFHDASPWGPEAPPQDELSQYKPLGKVEVKTRCAADKPKGSRWGGRNPGRGCSPCAWL